MKRYALVCSAAALCAGCRDGPLAPATEHRDYEVWLVDQSDSPGKTFGGTIYIYQRAAIATASGTAAGDPAKIDLGVAASALCLASTGANPVRPHFLTFNASHSHAILSFVASGHVVLFDAARREPVACLRASVGAGGGRQAHSAVPAPDDSYILVANQNGKRLERISTTTPRIGSRSTPKRRSTWRRARRPPAPGVRRRTCGPTTPPSCRSSRRRAASPS
jgi:hypothetical protein